MSPDKKELTPNKEEEKSQELKTAQYLVETVKKLQTEIQNLKLELKKARKVPSGKIGIAFIIPGIAALIFSIMENSTTLAFIGLSLTFWGAIFFFIKPIQYVQSSLLASTATPTYATIDRIIKDLKFQGKSYYIPPYPKEVYLPEHLKGLKEAVVFISTEKGGVPSIEELAKSKFILENPNGICISPPGLGIFTQTEKELGREFTQLQLNELCETLPQIIVENLQLAKGIKMNAEGNQVHVKIYESTYKSLYTAEKNLKSTHTLGCPLTSAIACAIAKTTGKMVTIQKDTISPDGQIEVWYRTVEG